MYSSDKFKNLKAPVFFIGAFIFLLLGAFYDFNFYDEGVILTGAYRVSAGELPYSSFWTMYSPGIYYFWSFIFSIVGKTLFIERIVSVVIAFVLVYYVYAVGLRYIKTNLNWTITSMCLVLFSAFPLYGRANLVALLLFIVFTFHYFSYIENKSIKQIIFCGIFAGMATLFRYEYGIYILIIGSCLNLFINLTLKAPDKKEKIKSFIKAESAFIMSYIVIVAPVAIYYLLSVPFELLMQQLYDVPTKIYTQYRYIPLPFFKFFTSGEIKSLFQLVKCIYETIMFLLPLSIVFYFIFSSFADKYEGKVHNIDHVFYQKLFLVAFALVFWSNVLIRADLEHLLPSLLPTFLMLGVLFKKTLNTRTKKVLFCCFVLFIMSYPFVGKMLNIAKSYSSSNAELIDIPAAGRIHTEKLKAASLSATVKFIQENTAKEDKIFVACERHDMIYINDVLFYFLAERLPAVFYHELHPGVATTDKVQLEIIASLEKNNVKYIVVSKVNFVTDNTVNSSTNSELLDYYIQENYTLERQFGDYSILKRVVAAPDNLALLP